MTPIELQNRLNTFCVHVKKLESYRTSSTYSINLIKQLIRSTSSVSLNYAEACVAESKRDFVHKLRLCLKEINESKVNLGLLAQCDSDNICIAANGLQDECGQLFAILYRSVITAQENLTDGQK